MPTTITVNLGERTYPIVIGDGLLHGDKVAGALAGSDCLVVSNETVAPLYIDVLRKSLADVDVSEVRLADGEAHKNMQSVATVIDKLVDNGANRDTTVIALGGGVVGDIAGFAAACYMRGLPFIQVPTTLLAQVDSSVGGKTGVNHPAGKNLIGAFHQPALVVIDIATLATLPERELRAGLAEVIKHAAIADSDYFTWLEQNMQALLARDSVALTHAIRRSCEIKAAVVAADEREQGQRALLNFGHTFGHAIERCMGYGEWLHGEAVAAGMIMAASLSGIDDEQQQRLRQLVAAAGLPVEPPAAGPDALRQAMGLDKKVQQKKLRFVLLDRIGQARLQADCDERQLAAVLQAAQS